jgi:hypothetical protein
MKALDLSKIGKRLARNKYLWLVLGLGLFLLLLPRQTAATAEQRGGRGDALAASGIPLETESERLAALLGEIEGVGAVRCLLSAEGAVIVCAGGADAAVRYLVTKAVTAYTGLGSDKITVMKMK